MSNGEKFRRRRYLSENYEKLQTYLVSKEEQVLMSNFYLILEAYFKPHVVKIS